MEYQVLKCFLLTLLPFFSLVVTLSCSNGTQHNVRTHTHEPKDMCKLVLEKFSQTVSDYTSCVASFARPIELCLRCRDMYVSVGTAYNYMEDFSQDNYTCKEVLTKQDRLNVIGKMYDSVIGSNSLWQLASCNSKLRFIFPVWGHSITTWTRGGGGGQKMSVLSTMATLILDALHKTKSSFPQ